MLLTLYINTAANQLLSSLNNPVVVNSVSTPLFSGDSGLIVQLYFLVPTQTTNPSTFNYVIDPNSSGYSPEMFLTNGIFGSGILIYTQQVTWTYSPTGGYFYAVFPLNTQNGWNGMGSIGVDGLMDGKTGTQATLQVGYLTGGSQSSTLYLGMSLLPGIPNAVGAVPGGLTPLSQQAADQRYVLQVGKPGQGFILVSAAGVRMMIHAVDTGPGTAQLQADPSP